jgi:hypothetical protein
VTEKDKKKKTNPSKALNLNGRSVGVMVCLYLYSK